MNLKVFFWFFTLLMIVSLVSFAAADKFFGHGNNDVSFGLLEVSIASGIIAILTAAVLICMIVI